MVLYGQVVVGPPGSGKTTYCNGMQQYLRLIGRECYVVNLDPANEYYRASSHLAPPPPATEDDDDGGHDQDGQQREAERSLPYETIVNVCDDMISLSSVMARLGLGPNGGLLYCMEYLNKHVGHLGELLRQRIADLDGDDGDRKPYLLFDFPGQAELVTHCTSVQDLLGTLVKSLDLRLCAVQLIDSHFCAEADKFIGAALLGTSTMIRLELPTVNVLSKVDLLESGGHDGQERRLPFHLDFFTEAGDLSRLVDYLDADPWCDEHDAVDYADDQEYRDVRTKLRSSHFHRRHRRLHTSICELVDDFGLLSFLPLNIQDADSVGRVVARVDKCNGYVFTTRTAELHQVNDLFRCAVQADDDAANNAASVQERFLGNLTYQETIPELSREGGDDAGHITNNDHTIGENKIKQNDDVGE